MTAVHVEEVTIEEARTAPGMLKDLLITLHKQIAISMAHPQTDSQTESTLRTVMICDRFAGAYLLKKLMEIDPAAAEAAAADLASIFEDGGAVHENAWEYLTHIGIDPNMIAEPAMAPASRYRELIQAMDIFAKYTTGGPFEVAGPHGIRADHDKLWAGPAVAEMRSYDRRTVEALGWKIDPDLQVYVLDIV